MNTSFQSFCLRLALFSAFLSLCFSVWLKFLVFVFVFFYPQLHSLFSTIFLAPSFYSRSSSAVQLTAWNMTSRFALVSVKEHTHTNAHTPTHLHIPPKSQMLFQTALELGEDRGLLRWSMRPWGWQRGHDCLLGWHPLPWNSTEAKPHQKPELTIGDKKWECYFNSRHHAIHHRPLMTNCAVKLSFPRRNRNSSVKSIHKKSKVLVNTTHIMPA